MFLEKYKLAPALYSRIIPCASIAPFGSIAPIRVRLGFNGWTKFWANQKTFFLFPSIFKGPSTVLPSSILSFYCRYPLLRKRLPLSNVNKATNSLEGTMCSCFEFILLYSLFIVRGCHDGQGRLAAAARVE
ncbi:uncharacterized protein F4807DRAFT_431873 [Annulohypoxylon truncatum]|uniref:uncharacterized protein n=1 Tax=Annulohypoxylon truncatum TaxID=327061 RepID=UPI002008B42C|nr:uncharacterized protein F4807DRAFT_431873 [Annulohypoxylon truncatum]KAI1208177.1 hypothetical protein F4807DRAFT_431873 [Annulohypoxylon truncatum]